MSARKAFLEVMQQIVNRIVRHVLMLKSFCLFPSVGQPAAIAILSSTVDIEVKVETRAMEITRLYARHSKKSKAVPKPEVWPPSDEDFSKLSGGNFEKYLFICRQGQKGSAKPENSTTCPALLQ